jgi:hypothetical protein
MKLYIMQFSLISYQSQPQNIGNDQRCSQTQLPIHLQCHSQSIGPIYLKYYVNTTNVHISIILFSEYRKDSKTI